jgi:hypothetical protein
VAIESALVPVAKVVDTIGGNFEWYLGADIWGQSKNPRDNPLVKQAIFYQEVGFIDIPVSDIWSLNATNILQNFSDNTDNANIPYDPRVRNSNSYAFQAVERLGLPRPAPLLWAPGASTVLPVP